MQPDKMTNRLNEALQLASEGYDPVFGVWPLKRLIKRTILDELAHRIISGEVREGHSVTVGSGNGRFTFSSKV